MDGPGSMSTLSRFDRPVSERGPFTYDLDDLYGVKRNIPYQNVRQFPGRQYRIYRVNFRSVKGHICSYPIISSSYQTAMSDLGTQSELILNKNFIHEEEDMNEDLKITEDSLKINEDSSGVHTNSYNTFESDATKITELDMAQKTFQHFEELPSRDSNEPIRSQDDHEGDHEADDESNNCPEESPISEAFYEATEGQKPRESEDEVDDMAQQILKSASSIRNSQSEERLKQCQHSSILSPRFSLTDSQLIEEQTRISFNALFGQPIPPDSDDHPIVELRKSTGYAMDGISNPAFNADVQPTEPSERPLTTIPSYESTEEGARQPTDSPTKEVKSEDLLSTFEVAPPSFYKSKSESDHDMVNADFLTNQIQPAQSAQIYVSSSMLSSNISDDVFRDNSERALPLRIVFKLIISALSLIGCFY